MNAKQKLKNMLTVGMVALSLLLVAMYLQAYLTQPPATQSPAGLIVGTSEPSAILVGIQAVGVSIGTPGVPQPMVTVEPSGTQWQRLVAIMVEVTEITDPTERYERLVEMATEFPIQFQPAEDPNLLPLGENGYRIEPGLAPEWQQLLVESRETNNDTIYGVLQFEVPFDLTLPIKFNELEGLGVQLINYRKEWSLTQAIIPRSALPTIAEWIATGKLRYAGPIPVDLRVGSPVWEYASTHPNDPVPIRLTIFEWPGDPSQPIPYLYPQARVFSSRVIYIESWVDPWDIEALAELPQTMGIGYRPIEEFCVEAGFDKYCGIEPTPSR